MHIAILIENPTKTTLNHSMSKRSLRENVNQRQLKPYKEGAYSVASLISVVTKKERKNKKNNKTKWSPQPKDNSHYKKAHESARGQFAICFWFPSNWWIGWYNFWTPVTNKSKPTLSNFYLDTEKQSCKENQISPKYSIHSYLVHFSYTNYAKTEKENR